MLNSFYLRATFVIRLGMSVQYTVARIENLQDIGTREIRQVTLLKICYTFRFVRYTPIWPCKIFDHHKKKKKKEKRKKKVIQIIYYQPLPVKK